MKLALTLRLLAVAVLVGANLWWIAGGAHRGWSQTRVPVYLLDEVTGITGITYESRFVPGLDFLGAAWLAAGVLAGASLFGRKPVQPSTHEHMKHTLTLLSLCALAGTALAAPMTFDFKDPKGVNNAVFKLDAPLEAINGSASSISGTVTFDPANPGATKGKIVVAASSLMVPNPVMKDHLHGERWLDVKRHAEISFDVTALKNVKTTGNETTADATGTFLLRGVAKEMTVPVRLTYLPDRLSSRSPNLKGDLLVIRSTFTIPRGDFGIMPGQNTDTVAENVEIVLSIAGASPK